MHPRALSLVLLGLSCRKDASRAVPPPSPWIDGDAGTSVLRRAREPTRGCPARAPASLLGLGTEHIDLVDRDERWTAEGSPHRVPYGLRVAAGATLTIDPCALVRVGPRKGITVRARSALVVLGTEASPVRFEPLSDGPDSAWLGLDLEPEARDDTRLVYVKLEGAGAAPELVDEVVSALRVRMRRPLWVEHLEVARSRGYGVALTDGARFDPRSRGLQVHGAQGDGAVYFSDADAVASLPPGEYHGNRRDDLCVAARRRELTADARWPWRGLRYRVLAATHLMVQGPARPTLRLEAGVTVAFEPGAELDVGWDAPGDLVAEGAAGVPVRLEPAEGSRAESWGGVYLGAHVDPSRTWLTHVEIVGAATDPAMRWRVCPDASDGASPRALVALDALPRMPTMTHLRFVAGPPDGYALLLAGDHPGGAPGPFALDPTADVSLAGTRCVVTRPVVQGRCAISGPCQRPGAAPMHNPARGARAAPGG
ncbi:MAG: hypothetical protein HY909_10465 [Deltaproteobacteria bacterium]|nr:hypothetical protein [Deltaproteobacteria bacterium]